MAHAEQIVDTSVTTRRLGGRKARRDARANKDVNQAVRPGMKGGTYRPLSDHDMDQIHQTVLRVLEHVGVGDPIPELREKALEKGCWMDDDNRLHFPAALVEDVIAGACRDAVLYGRDPKYDCDLKGADVFYSPGAEAVTTLDFETGEYRPSTLVDYYDFSRLVDKLEHVHMMSRVIVATDIANDWYLMDANLTYAQLAGTMKHNALGFANGENLERCIPMLDMIAGGEGKFAKRPFASAFGCPIVSPLTYGEDNCTTLVSGIKLNAPVDAVIAPQAGATAPAPLAGTLVQVTAETLASLLMVNIIKPSHPVIFGAWPFVSDMRTGAFSGGGGEQALLGAAAGQLGLYYDLPTSTGAGMSDSNSLDIQMGFEKGITSVLAALSGCNAVTEVAGMTATLMGCSFESMVIDNEMLAMIQRAVRGIEVTEETLSFDVIKEISTGPRHFLGHPQTLKFMETEFLYPEFSDRDPTSVWEEKGSVDMTVRAKEVTRNLLSSHYPEYIDPAVDAKIREHYPIRLSKEDMRAECGRW